MARDLPYKAAASDYAERRARMNGARAGHAQVAGTGLINVDSISEPPELPKSHGLSTRRGCVDEKARNRAAILDAADRLLREVGFDAFAMEPVARRAGIAKGTLYLYFETREEVLLSLHAQQLTAWSEAVTRSIRPGMSDAAFARTFFDASRADPAFLDLAARLGNVLERNVCTGVLSSRNESRTPCSARSRRISSAA